MPVEVLQDLNPELRRWTTPVRATDYDLKVPMGKAEDSARAAGRATPEDLAPLNRYTVARARRIATIARS